MCALQHMAEASVGQRWVMERGTRVSKISRLVEIFLNATGRWVSPNIIWQCWPAQHEDTPVQNLEGFRQGIVCKLDKVVLQCPSSIAWDKFVFPQSDQEFWREEALCYHPGKMLDIGACMMGFRLMLQDDKGQYPNSGHALIFEGSMLVYDPQHDIVQWVPVWGMSATLTMMELCVANNLNNMVPLPYSEVEPVRPPSPKIVKGIPAGAKSDMDSLAIDSRDEWDKAEVGVWSCCPTPMAKIGPTWAEVHTAAQEEEVIKKQDLTWDDIVSRQLPGDMEEEDWGREEGNHPTVEPQFKDATIEEEEDEEEVIVELVTEEKSEQPVAREPLAEELGEATIDPGNCEVVQIHTGEDDL